MARLKRTVPYRDEKEALRAKLADLEKAVQDIDARSRELEHLQRDETALRRERDALRNKLRALEGGRKLPLLDNVQVASPCSESWSDMVGDDTARFCLKCEKNVYDLSSMTRAEAEAVIVAKEGELCVRFHRRADGTVLTADCPVGVARKRRRRIAALTVLGAGLASLGSYVYSSLTTCHFQGAIAVQGDMSEPRAMGTVAPPPTPETPPTADTATEMLQGKPSFVMGSPPPAVHPEPKHR